MNYVSHTIAYIYMKLLYARRYFSKGLRVENLIPGFIMVCHFQRKTNRSCADPDIVLRAVRQVKISNASIRSTAKEFGINYRTLTRKCQIASMEDLNEQTTKLSFVVSYYSNRKVFSDSEEEALVQYLVRASNSFFWLTAKEVKKLAYELAKANSIY